MKKLMMFTAAASLCLFLSVSAAHAQGGWSDLNIEGQQVVAASKYLLAQAQKIKAAKNMDRAWMIDEGNQLIKHGYNYMETGEMYTTDEGISNMQELGRKALQTGQVLLMRGRKQGPVTQKEKDEIAKQVEYMQGIGKLMLEKGQLMGGNL